MSRPLRNRDPSKKHLITIRTDQAAIWMIPKIEINQTIGGILARYQEIFEIVIYAYSVNGNHYHLLLQAPKGNLDEFMENLNREIARRMNWHHHRKAKFWARRYDDQIVLNEAAELEAFLYVTTNPTKHGLVSHPREWPGLNCYSQVLDGRDRHYQFTHYSLSSPEELIKTSHRVRLTPLPQHQDLTLKERRRLLLKLINDRVSELREQRKEAGQGFATRELLYRQAPGSIPKNIATSRRPACYSKEAKLIRQFKTDLRKLRLQYSKASVSFRKGNLDIKFPEFTFHPPLHRTPRLVPFGHIKKQLAA